jgi:hypothetical protein
MPQIAAHELTNVCCVREGGLQHVSVPTCIASNVNTQRVVSADERKEYAADCSTRINERVLCYVKEGHGTKWARPWSRMRKSAECASGQTGICRIGSRLTTL